MVVRTIDIILVAVTMRSVLTSLFQWSLVSENSSICTIHDNAEKRSYVKQKEIKYREVERSWFHLGLQDCPTRGAATSEDIPGVVLAVRGCFRLNCFSSSREMENGHLNPIQGLRSQILKLLLLPRLPDIQETGECTQGHCYREAFHFLDLMVIPAERANNCKWWSHPILPSTSHECI